MNQSSHDLVDLLRTFFATTERWPKPLHRIQGALLVQGGMEIAKAAQAVGTTPSNLRDLAQEPEPIEIVLGVRDADLDQFAIDRLKRKIGELLLGRAAEIAFEDICQGGIDPTEYSLGDLRQGRNNTDYLLLNGGGRRLCRFNVKFFGTPFRRALEMVGLDPNDCFPLASYKIKAALEQEAQEHLPYIFAIVGVLGLDAKAVGNIVPEKDVRPVALLMESKAVRRKRDFEDWIVDRVVAAKSPPFTTTFNRIRAAQWYVLSARRANKLLVQLLYNRVHAIAIRGFTRNFPTAEVDMHFSLSKDMVTLPDFLKELRNHGQGKVTHMLTDGFW